MFPCSSTACSVSPSIESEAGGELRLFFRMSSSNRSRMESLSGLERRIVAEREWRHFEGANVFLRPLNRCSSLPAILGQCDGTNAMAEISS